MTLLNISFWDKSDVEPAAVPARFAAIIESIHSRYYDQKSQRFNYKGFAVSQDYNDYCATARLLNQFRPSTLTTRQEKIAFWLNVYNGLVLHGVTALKLKEGLGNASGFFSDCCYQVGCRVVSLDDIEHGILRGNAKKYRGLNRLIGRKDPRWEWVVEPVDPRVHFAFYSACCSSPLWRIFRPDTLDGQLDEAVCLHLEACIERRDEGQRLYLTVPKWFYWYTADFGQNGADSIAFIAHHLRNDHLGRWLLDNADRIVLQYLPFDWTLNQLEDQPWTEQAH